MSDDLLIEPLVLDPADFPPLPLEPGFTQLVNDSLGASATPADGFDPVLEDLIAIVDSLDSGLSLLAGADGGDLDTAFEEILALDPTDAGQHVVDLVAALTDEQGNVDNLGNLLGSSSAPTPPGGGGGSGGGGAGGGNSQDVCTGAQQFLDMGTRQLGSAAVDLTVQYFNRSTTATVTITGATITGGAPVWTQVKDTRLPIRVPPQGPAAINIGVNPVEAGTWYTMLTVTLTGAPSPITACLKLIVE